MQANHLTRHMVGRLGITEIVSWGSIYYAISLLAPDIQRELGWRAETVYGAFSWSLLVAGLLATPAGVLIDRIGGRIMMSIGSVTAGCGLVLLAKTNSAATYYGAWTLLGAAMALTLYDAAFATVNREILGDSRKTISALTLFGGFASTVFWPLTLQVNGAVGWRDTYFLYGLVHFLLCLPLHLLLPVRRKEASAPRAAGDGNYTLREALRHPAFWKLAFAFASNSFIFAALSVHLIPILHWFGHPMAAAVAFAALIGPMQVAGRIGEMVFARRARPQTAGSVTFAILPAALLGFILLGSQQWMAAFFCSLYGMSNGILTIVRGTVPQALFGRENYGAITGALAGPALLAKAAGPLTLAVFLHASSDWRIALAAMLLLALASLACYLAAVRAEQGAAAQTLQREPGTTR